jgi:choline dehydrogenase-like flavoprotein
MPLDCDVVVVGSGAGGGSFAHACAQAGKSVILLERGRSYQLTEPVHDEQTMLIDRAPYDDRAIAVNGQPRRLYMGGILGGSTALYGAALMRPSPDDFHPGANYGQLLPRTQWDWPISYDTLEPYYAEAETLFGVSGSSDDDFAPLPKPKHGFRERPLPLHPVNRQLIDANRRGGLRPFRLPLAIDSDRCLQCRVCPGYVCPNGARHSAAQLLERPAPTPPTVLPNTEAEEVLLDGKGVAEGIRAVDGAPGPRNVYSARR